MDYTVECFVLCVIVAFCFIVHVVLNDENSYSKLVHVFYITPINYYV